MSRLFLKLQLHIAELLQHLSYHGDLARLREIPLPFVTLTTVALCSTYLTIPFGGEHESF